MENLGQIFSSAIWVVKSGNEQKLIDLWSDFADWTGKNIAGSTEASLLQSLDEPQKFLSFGPWQSLESVEDWRSRPQFKEYFSQLQEICEEITPMTLKKVAYHSKPMAA